MIRPLRTRHRRTVAALWIVVPALLAWALLSRPPQPRMDDLPAWRGEATPAGHPRRVAGTPFELDGVRAEAAVFSRGVERHLRLRLLERSVAPDLLAYWTAGAGKDGGDGLPADATLLGRVPGTREIVWRLPADGGSIVLYSLAHQRRVASGALPTGSAGESRGGEPRGGEES